MSHIRAINIIILLLTTTSLSQNDNGAFLPQHFVAVSPSQNQLNVKNDCDIQIDFDSLVDLYSLDSSTFMIYGIQSGFHQGQLSYDTLNSQVRFISHNKFTFGEIVKNTLTGNIKTKNGIPIGKSFVWYFSIQSKGGSGIFDSALVFNTGYYPEGICTADFNKDGILDLATPNYASDDCTIAVLFGNGVGTFNLNEKYPAARFPYSILAADVDHDNDMDIVVGNEENYAISVFYNNGKGSFTPRKDFFFAPDGFYPSICAIDLEGDGDIDIARSTSQPGTKIDDLLLLINNGSGNFDSSLVIQVGDWPRKLSARDIDKDGDDDIIVPHWMDNNITILFNEAGDFSNRLTINTGYGADAVCPNDFNGDSFMDVVVANNAAFNMSVLLNDGSNNFRGTNYQTGNLPASIAANDFDGDNKLDLALNAGSNYVSVFLNDGTGRFGRRSDYKSYGGPNYVISADFDNDGDIDIAATNRYSSTISIFLNHNSNTSVQQRNEATPNLVLNHNYPNPLNLSTVISFQLLMATYISLKIYDVLGQEIATLSSKELEAGNYSFRWESSEVSSGLYFYRLSTGSFIETRRLVVVK